MSAGRLDTIITQRVESALGVSLSAKTELAKVGSSSHVTPAGKSEKVAATESATHKPVFAQLIAAKTADTTTRVVPGTQSLASSSSASAGSTPFPPRIPEGQTQSARMQLSPAGRILFAVFDSYPGSEKPITSAQPLFISAVMRVREQAMQQSLTALTSQDQNSLRAQRLPVITAISGQASSPLAQALTLVLTQAIVQSGLFYEAQMLRAFRSERPNTTTLREQPQGRQSPGTKLLDVDQSIDRPRHSAELMPLIRQQLDALSNSVIHWSGQAWPNVSLDWRIAPYESGAKDHEDSHAQHGSNETPEGWSSTLDLELTQLGPVKVNIVIDDRRLSIKLSVDPAYAPRFEQQLPTLKEHLQDLGATINELRVVES